MILATHAPRTRSRGFANGTVLTDDVPRARRTILHAGSALHARKIVEMRNLRFKVVEQGHLMSLGTMVNAVIETLTQREISPACALESGLADAPASRSCAFSFRSYTFCTVRVSSLSLSLSRTNIRREL